jgi:hypothetical protein
VVNVTVRQRNANGHHIENIDAGGYFLLIPAWIDDDAFFFSAGKDVTICLPRTYDNSFDHDILQPKGFVALYQYTL